MLVLVNFYFFTAASSLGVGIRHSTGSGFRAGVIF